MHRYIKLSFIFMKQSANILIIHPARLPLLSCLWLYNYDSWLVYDDTLVHKSEWHVQLDISMHTTLFYNFYVHMYLKSRWIQPCNQLEQLCAVNLILLINSTLYFNFNQIVVNILVLYIVKDYMDSQLIKRVNPNWFKIIAHMHKIKHCGTTLCTMKSFVFINKTVTLLFI